MKAKYFMWIFLLLGTVTLQAQHISFVLEVDQDTVTVGQTISVTYTLRGARGNIQVSDFANFQMVAGPNYSTNITIEQGHIRQLSSYNYVFQMTEAGYYIIPEASVEVGGKTYTSPSTEIFVLDDENWDPAKMKPLMPKKKIKKKTTEI